MGIKLERKNHFFTWSQTGETTKEEVLSKIQEHLNPKWYIVGQEQHKDGGKHLHLYCETEDKPRKDFPTDAFDVNGHHPNIKIGRPKIHIPYCGKEDTEPLCNFDHEEWIAQKNKKKSVRLAFTRGQGVKRAFEDGLIEWNELDIYKRNKALYDAACLTNHADYNLDDFAVGALSFSTVKCWVVKGEAHCGKTQYAMAHFDKPLIVRDIDDLKDLEPGEHDGIVFDDFSPYDWSIQQLIHLTDHTVHSTIRCRTYNAKIPKWMPRIFTTNETQSFPNVKQVQRRIREYKVEGPLYVPNVPNCDQC